MTTNTNNVPLVIALPVKTNFELSSKTSYERACEYYGHPTLAKELIHGQLNSKTRDFVLNGGISHSGEFQATAPFCVFPKEPTFEDNYEYAPVRVACGLSTTRFAEATIGNITNAFAHSGLMGSGQVVVINANPMKAISVSAPVVIVTASVNFDTIFTNCLIVLENGKEKVDVTVNTLKVSHYIGLMANSFKVKSFETTDEFISGEMITTENDNLTMFIGHPDLIIRDASEYKEVRNSYKEDVDEFFNFIQLFNDEEEDTPDTTAKGSSIKSDTKKKYYKDRYAAHIAPWSLLTEDEQLKLFSLSNSKLDEICKELSLDTMLKPETGKGAKITSILLITNNGWNSGEASAEFVRRYLAKLDKTVHAADCFDTSFGEPAAKSEDKTVPERNSTSSKVDEFKV